MIPLTLRNNSLFLVLHEKFFPYPAIRLFKLFSVTVPHVRIFCLLSPLVCKFETILLTPFYHLPLVSFSYLLHVSTYIRHLCLNKPCQHSETIIYKLASIVYPNMLFCETTDSIFYQLTYSLNY